MLLLVLIVILGASLFYYFIVKPFHYWTERGIKQGNPKWIFGDNLGTITKKQNLAELTDMIYKQWPGFRYSGMYQFFIPTLMLKDPDLIKQTTIKDFDHFTDHLNFVPEDADPLWNKHLVSLKGQRWHEMRTVLSPSFTSAKMRSMFILITECAENFMQHFLKKNEEVITLDLKDAFSRFTNDVIATSAFGVRVDSLGEPNNQFYLMGKELTNFTGFWRMMKFFGYMLAPKLLQLLQIPLFSSKATTFFSSVISQTIKKREEEGIVRPDMINQLLQARKGVTQREDKDVIDTGFSVAQEADLGKAKVPKEISDMDITAQAMIFFFAGFEGVSGLMSFMSYELAIHPEIQDRLRHEIRSTLDECGGKLTYEGLLKMKYMDMVISESLRKWPFVVSMDRICTKPYTIQPVNPDEKPVHLAKGDVIIMPIYGLHRDPRYFPDPERFDPERFNDKNKNDIKPYTYLPFGLGPRNCVGSRFALLETKTIFFYLLNSFEIVPVERSRIPLQLCRNQLNMTAEGGFWFGLKRLTV